MSLTVGGRGSAAKGIGAYRPAVQNDAPSQGTNGTYGTYETKETRPISPVCPIGPIRSTSLRLHHARRTATPCRVSSVAPGAKPR
jgi:hypothetical protein